MSNLENGKKYQQIKENEKQCMAKNQLEQELSSGQREITEKQVQNVQIDEISNMNITEIQKQILNNMNIVYRLRIPQKVASPISQEIKRGLISNFQDRFNQINKNIKYFPKRILKLELQNCCFINKMEQQKYNSTKILQAKLAITSIRKKYAQIFIMGSFSYLQKIAKFNNLRTNHQIIDIEKWAQMCSEELQKKVKNAYSKPLKCC